MSGKAGNVRGELEAGGNIFEGPRSEEYPTPPNKMPHFSVLYEDAVKSLGYHPYPYPAATISTAYTNPDGVSRPGCLYCGFCNGYPCMIGAKSQPTNTLLPAVGKHKSVEIRTGTWVRRLIHDQIGSSRRMRGVTYINEKGEEYFQPAELVILASWSMGNVRQLLLSNVEEPYDPTTGKGNLGRNLTWGVNITGAQVFLDQTVNRFMGAASAGIRIGDMDGDLIDHKNLPFLRGGNFGAMSSGYQPITTFGTLPRSIQSSWGAEWKKAAIHFYDRWGFINFLGEHFAYRGNFMDLDPRYTDQFGDPLLRLTLDWQENELKMFAFARDKAVEMARAMGAKDINPFDSFVPLNLPQTPLTHTCGGAILSNNPERSVVNTYMQHWNIPNLFVIGGSAFPQQASANPTLTILALTYRTSDQIVDRYLHKPGPLA